MTYKKKLTLEEYELYCEQGGLVDTLLLKEADCVLKEWVITDGIDHELYILTDTLLWDTEFRTSKLWKNAYEMFKDMVAEEHTRRPMADRNDWLLEIAFDADRHCQDFFLCIELDSVSYEEFSSAVFEEILKFLK